MSESAPEGVEQPTDGGTSSGWTPPASQQELNRIISERVGRERAKYADYEELRGKAAEIDAANEKAAQAEAAVAEIPVRVAAELRAHLVAVHKIDADDADLFLTANDPAVLLKQVERLVGRSNTSTTNFVPREGTSTTAKPDATREAVRGLFGGSS